MTYADAVEWAIDNVPLEFYDSYDDWLGAVRGEIETPELFASSEFNKQMERVWENEVGDIRKTRQQLEQEKEEQKRIEEFEEPEIEEPEVREPTAREVEQELARNLPDDSPVKREILGGVETNITITSIPQKVGAPIKITRSPTGLTTMTRPPTLTPPIIKVPVTATFRETLRQVATTVTSGVKRGVGVIRGVLRI